MSQNHVPMIRAHERQLAYLITVVNSLFSYGMPAAMTKLSRNRRTASQDYGQNIGMDGSNHNSQAASQASNTEQSKFLDFYVVGKIFYLGHLTNQLRQSQGMKPPELELEASLLNFARVFKNHVLTDSRVIMLCSTLY